MTEKICATANAVSLERAEGHSPEKWKEEASESQVIHLPRLRQNRSHARGGLICQLTETAVLLVLAESHADAACAMRAGTDQFRAGWLTKRQIVRQATCMVADGRLSLGERQEYDLCNDQALPNLQAATNQARTNGYRALRLR
jgi:hypothetical protein